ncbi:MAG: helicase-exonuclease AddAB subunit AddA [Epulopiscium sp.]|nr:helicase-exonuclease AddAB subunit AddA [Candidatus Epulonipiscium sp.]
MSVTWTPEQQAAIDVRDKNILVSAAAGSGKTAVLVERIIERISDLENPVDVDRLLIVTFTNAAALEMKERIGDGIESKLEEDPNNLHLQRQLHLLQRSSISTIHAFCLRVIRNYFHQIEIDPAFRIGNDAELKVIKEEVLGEVLEEFFESGDKDFIELVEAYTTPKSTKQLEEMVLTLHEFSQSTRWPQEWLESSVKDLSKDYKNIEDTKWAKIIHDNIETKLDGAIMAANNALSLCKAPNGPGHYEPMIEDDIRQLKDCKDDSLLQVVDNIFAIKYMNLSRKGYECDPDLKKEVQTIRNDSVKKTINKIKTDFALRSEEEMLDDINKSSRAMKSLVELVVEFSNKYQEAKAEKSIVDYSDLEHYCLEILLDKESKPGHIVPSIVARELQEFYEEIYIDEYQDSNIVQETMLRVISRDDENRFMVGDIKQSIYRFRLANPLLFIEKHDEYEKYKINEELGNKVYIELVNNFRSRGNVLDGINFIFDQIMSRKVGEVEYDESVALYTGAKYLEPSQGEEVGGPVELHIVSGEDLEGMNKREAETLLVANMVKEILDGEKSPTHVYDKRLKGYRRVEPKDIVILLRTTVNTAQDYVDALVDVGVGAFADVATGYFETIEIQTILALLSIIDNPLQDIPLLTVLRSPIVGLTLDELAIIRKSEKYGTFYEALNSYINETQVIDKEDKLLGKLESFIESLDKYRRWAIDFPMDQLISKLFIDTGYYQYVGMLATGPQKQANLRILKSYAAEFEESSFTGLFNFMNYIDRVKSSSGDFAEAKTVGENENLVRIMSIHKSKGLEFPIVILAVTDKQFNNRDLINPVLLHQELGFGAKYIDVEDRVNYNTLARLAISQQIRAENLSEEMRVLYVALTRAKEKLIITGSVDNFEKSVKSWGQNLKRDRKEIGAYATMDVRCYLDWIGMAFLSHPDAKEIRDLIPDGNEGYIVNDEKSKWAFKLWDKSNLPSPIELEKSDIEKKKDEILNWDKDIVHGKYKEEIEERLNWTYRYEEATKLPVKMSVSEIKQRWSSQDEDSQILSFAQNKPSNSPSFMEERRRHSPTERGTMIHNVLQHLDVGNSANTEDVKVQIEKMILQGRVNKDVIDLVNLNRLVEFSKSDIVGRMIKSNEIYKEQQFVFLMDAKELIPDFKDAAYSEEVMVQGVIDCFFKEDNGYILVDYKTDYVPEGQEKSAAIEKLKNNYKKQIEIYGRAIKDITGKKVKESYLYLYSINEWVRI